MALRTKTLIAALALALVAASGARAQVASPYALDVPPWFALSFLDFRDDVAERGGQAGADLLRSGRLPVLQDAAGDQFFAALDRGEDARPSSRWH
jgi:hypothetical protein